MILGTYKIPKDQVVSVILLAAKSGVRDFDTAELYKNLQQVGEGVRLCTTQLNIPREELCVITKISYNSLKKRNVVKSIKKSIELLNIGYIDIVLLHCPERYIDNWTDLDMFQRQNPNKVINIGVSNFDQSQLDEIIPIRIPMCNQIEISPKVFRDDLIKFCIEKKIIPMAHSILSKRKLLQDKELIEIATRLKISVTQLIIGWLYSNGCRVVTSSMNKEHISENCICPKLPPNIILGVLDQSFICYPRFIN